MPLVVNGPLKGVNSYQVDRSSECTPLAYLPQTPILKNF